VESITRWHLTQRTSIECSRDPASFLRPHRLASALNVAGPAAVLRSCASVMRHDRTHACLDHAREYTLIARATDQHGASRCGAAAAELCGHPRCWLRVTYHTCTSQHPTRPSGRFGRTHSAARCVCHVLGGLCGVRCRVLVGMRVESCACVCLSFALVLRVARLFSVRQRYCRGPRWHNTNTIALTSTNIHRGANNADAHARRHQPAPEPSLLDSAADSRLNPLRMQCALT
jgi:hypothetical protein